MTFRACFPPRASGRSGSRAALRSRPTSQPHAQPPGTRARVRRRRPHRLRRFGGPAPSRTRWRPRRWIASSRPALVQLKVKRASSSFARATHGTRGRDGGSVGRDEAVQRAPGTSLSARWFPRATTTLDPLDRASTRFSKCPPRVPSQRLLRSGAHPPLARNERRKPPV